MADKYRPRLLLIIVCALIIAQIFVITSLKHEFEEQILAAQQAVNTQTLLQSALINQLVEKNIITHEELLAEAQKISERYMESQPAEAPPFDTTGLAPPDTLPAEQ
jgi:hypothetical protein